MSYQGFTFERPKTFEFLIGGQSSQVPFKLRAVYRTMNTSEFEKLIQELDQRVAEQPSEFDAAYAELASRVFEGWVNRDGEEQYWLKEKEADSEPVECTPENLRRFLDAPGVPTAVIAGFKESQMARDAQEARLGNSPNSRGFASTLPPEPKASRKP